MMQVKVNEAKAILPDLMIRAQAGEEIVIAGEGKSGVRLVPVSIATGGQRSFGRFSHMRITGDVLGPLDEDELGHWEGK